VRVLLDSSVLIAAHISRAGVCAELLDEVLMDHQLVVSDFILDEVVRKLREKFHFPTRQATSVRSTLAAAADGVTPADIPVNSCRDAADLPVLGTAIAGKVDVLITVDKDLLVLVSFDGIAIVKPGGFWKLQRARDE
jgi:putative PIN family toxin of toxin-antitoxin system